MANRNRSLLLPFLTWEVGISPPINVSRWSMINLSTSALETVPVMSRGMRLRSETRRGDPKSLLKPSEYSVSETFRRLRERLSPPSNVFGDTQRVD